MYTKRAIEDECTQTAASERRRRKKCEMRAHKDTALRTPLRSLKGTWASTAERGVSPHCCRRQPHTECAWSKHRRRLARERGNSTLWAICACARGVASEITSKYGTRNGAKIKSTICRFAAFGKHNGVFVLQDRRAESSIWITKTNTYVRSIDFWNDETLRENSFKTRQSEIVSEKLSPVPSDDLL